MSTIYTSQTLPHHLPLSNEASGYLHKKKVRYADIYCGHYAQIVDTSVAGKQLLLNK